MGQSNITMNLIFAAAACAVVANMFHQRQTRSVFDPAEAMRWFRRVLFISICALLCAALFWLTRSLWVGGIGLILLTYYVARQFSTYILELFHQAKPERSSAPSRISIRAIFVSTLVQLSVCGLFGILLLGTAAILVKVTLGEAVTRASMEAIVYKSPLFDVLTLFYDLVVPLGTGYLAAYISRARPLLHGLLSQMPLYIVDLYKLAVQPVDDGTVHFLPQIIFVISALIGPLLGAAGGALYGVRCHADRKTPF